VTLLWNYLNVFFDQRSAVQSISLVVFQYLRYQRLLTEMAAFIREHFRPDQFHQLTKSIFRLTDCLIAMGSARRPFVIREIDE
jgi:hypothetical protein